MIKYILIFLAVLVLGFVAVAAMQSEDMKITRSLKMHAAPPAVFPHVNELKKWEAWSPYVKMDPNMKTSYEGPSSGVGSSYAWDGNNNAGQGRLTITESKPDERIDMKLEFERPFKGTNEVVFTFQPDGEGTVVSWTMTGKKNFVSKAIGLLMDMDKMVGGQFDEGLNSLKPIVEAKASGQ